MYALMIYSLKAGACLAIFYLFFKLLLSRETFHRFNRIVILAATALSFVLPLCVITVYREAPLLSYIPMAVMAAAPAVPQPQPFPWHTILASLFLAGAVVSLLRTLGQMLAVVRMIRRGSCEESEDGAVLVHVARPIVPFSWFRYIVFPETDEAENGEVILRHERAHRRLGHSFDLLVMDLAGCLQWFNPAMWLLRRELRAIHEYEADREVLESGLDAKEYQLLLIKKAVGGRWYPIANSFNHNKLKNRIAMMLRKRSSRWAGVKLLFALPLTGLALGAFARTAYVSPEVSPAADKSTTKNVVVVADGTKILVNDDGSLQTNGMKVITVSSTDSLSGSNHLTVYATNDGNGKLAVRTVPGIQMDSIVGFSNGDSLVLISYGKARSAEPALVIRSAGKVDEANPPLFVIDGVVQKDGASLNDLDVSRIESVSVIKDATATETYGERGRNGVIYITTKDAGIMRGTGVDTGVGTTRMSRDKDSDGSTTRYQGTITLNGCPDAGLILINGEKSTQADVEAIAPGKIKRMVVLKGEDATAKYGEAGRDGVIEIKTRK